MTDNIRYIMEEYRQEIGSVSKHGGGEPPGGSQLEARVSALEKSIPEIREKLVRIETQLESMNAGMATKLDMAGLSSKDDLNGLVRASSKDIQDLAVAFQRSLNEQTWKFVGVAAALAGLAFTAAKFVGH